MSKSSTLPPSRVDRRGASWDTRKRGIALREQGLKHCPDCRQDLPFAAFSKSQANSGGLAGYCRKCCNARSRKYNDRLHSQHIKRTYGLTLDEYNVMFDAQGGVCAICGNPERRRQKGLLTRLNVDHDHATGAVRALLCSRCNTTIGQLDDNAALLRKAADYLDHWGKQQ